jgi:hypothetical protein
MGCTEVQRTLVKSPPELWAELSDPAALARHLGELGEIRITRLEPGEKVEWEAADTNGTVVLKPSGWGTKVTLTATSNAPAPGDETGKAPEPVISAPAAAAVREPADVPRGPAIEAWRELMAAASAETAFPPAPGPVTASSAPASAPAPSPERTPAGEAGAPAPTPEHAPGQAPEQASEQAPKREGEPPPVRRQPRRGFFARLFRRRPRPAPEPTRGAAEEPPTLTPSAGVRSEPSSTHAEVPEAKVLSGTVEVVSVRKEPAERRQAPAPPADAGPASPPEPSPAAKPSSPPEPSSAAEPSAAAMQSSPPDPSSAAEPSSAEEAITDGIASDRVAAVLTATLDRLGAAHHRPFSRA